MARLQNRLKFVSAFLAFVVLWAFMAGCSTKDLSEVEKTLRVDFDKVDKITIGQGARYGEIHDTARIKALLDEFKKFAIVEGESHNSSGGEVGLSFYQGENRLVRISIVGDTLTVYGEQESTYYKLKETSESLSTDSFFYRTLALLRVAEYGIPSV